MNKNEIVETVSYLNIAKFLEKICGLSSNGTIRFNTLGLRSVGFNKENHGKSIDKLQNGLLMLVQKLLEIAISINLEAENGMGADSLNATKKLISAIKNSDIPKIDFQQTDHLASYTGVERKKALRIKQSDFTAILEMLDRNKEFGFIYELDATSNDIFRKTQQYSFYVTNGSNKIEIKVGQTSKEHSINEAMLREKYSGFLKEWLETGKKQRAVIGNGVPVDGSENIMHGTVTAYINKRCRCEVCKNYMKEYSKSRKAENN